MTHANTAPTHVAILALPEVTASVLYGLSDLLVGAGRDWPLVVEDRPGDHYRLAHPRKVDLADYDVVHLRQDPPFDMAYITTTHLLERLQPRTVVVNDPASVRNAPESFVSSLSNA